MCRRPPSKAKSHAEKTGQPHYSNQQLGGTADYNHVMDPDNRASEGNERTDVSPAKPMRFLILLLLLELQNLLAQTLDLSLD